MVKNLCHDIIIGTNQMRDMGFIIDLAADKVYIGIKRGAKPIKHFVDTPGVIINELAIEDDEICSPILPNILEPNNLNLDTSISSEDCDHPYGLNDAVFKEWLTERDGKGHCKVCEATLNPGKSDLKEHSKTALHRRNIENFLTPKPSPALPRML